jgi:heme O synthase-like polyprenyltransferase
MTKRCLFFYLGCLCIILMIWLHQSPHSDALSLGVAKDQQEARHNHVPAVE